MSPGVVEKYDFINRERLSQLHSSQHARMSHNMDGIRLKFMTEHARTANKLACSARFKIWRRKESKKESINKERKTQNI